MSISPELDPRRVTGVEHPAAAPATVAIVTDDVPLAAACARVLQQEGFEVRTAVHAGHAVLACLAGKRIDLLVSEMSTAEGSGPALASRMRRFNPKLRALYFAKAGTLCGADNVLVRPFTRDDLLGAIRYQLSVEP